MDRFRKSHLVAVALALMVIANASSALAAGRRLSDRGIESGGNPEQEVTGEPDWGGGGRPAQSPEMGIRVAIAGIEGGLLALLPSKVVTLLSAVRMPASRDTRWAKRHG